MDRQRWKKISRIFDLALNLPQDRRTTYIKQLCTGDPELQQEINMLLASVEESDKMLDEQLRKNEALLSNLTAHLEDTDDSASRIGHTVGPWKITELLGRGGMGDVYEVERTDSDIQQKGALKIMRQGLNTPDNMRRFRLEKQILAGLDHPNIARLIDGGISRDDLPYLVMEYVCGLPIDQYCNRQKLSVDKRLILFKTVCEAVQHAHKNLVVHRDLKPDNVLVTNEGHVKILDFGIAKLLDPDLYEFSTIETRNNMRLMSLDYAAPEQVVGEAITTSTDVYALGVLLYKLLTGRHPFNFEELNYRAIEQKILHEDPPLPSQCLRDVPAKTDDIFSIDLSSLAGKLKGDLDAIILKALRKEPEHRYASVSQLVDDLDLYRSDKPVEARKSSVRYRISKFYARHKRGLLTAAASLLIIIALIAFYTFQLAQERNEARLEAQKSEQVKNLLVDIFQSGDPFADPNAKRMTIEQVLAQGANRVSQQLKSQPLVQAELQEALGSVYSGLIMYSEGEPLLRQALNTYKEKAGPDHPDVARASHLLGFMLLRKGQYEEAETLFNDAKRIYEQKFGPQDPHYANSLTLLANLYGETGRSEKALPYYQQAIAIYKQTDSPEIAGATQDLGYLLMGINQLEEAQQQLEKAITLFKTYYEQPETAIANALTGLGQTMQLKGNLAKAEDYHRRALQIRQKIFNAGHTYIASSLLRLGWVLVEQGRIKEGMPLVHKAYQSFKSHLPKNHWKIAASEGILALAWIQQGKYAKAETTLLHTYKVMTDQFGPENWRAQKARQTLAKLYLAWKKPQKAQNWMNN